MFIHNIARLEAFLFDLYDKVINSSFIGIRAAVHLQSFSLALILCRTITF